jgi:hypothetical protein
VKRGRIRVDRHCEIAIVHGPSLGIGHRTGYQGHRIAEITVVGEADRATGFRIREQETPIDTPQQPIPVGFGQFRSDGHLQPPILRPRFPGTRPFA